MTTEKIELSWIDRQGYRFYRHFDENGKQTMIAEHRLVAFAHGLIDDPFDPFIEVDHKDRVCWYNSDKNLQALSSEAHSRITRLRENEF